MAEIYREVLSRIDEVQLFDTLNIKLVIRERTDEDPLKNNRRYLVDHFEVNGDVSNSQLLEEVVTRITQLNDKLKGSDWNIFYVFKELFQILGDKSTSGLGFNYFRGQRDNWELRPGIARNTISSDLIDEYDHNYSEMVEKFPHDIKYVLYKKENRKDRAEQLAILQHYGFPTSLLDITSNPYIALEFMISGTNSEEKSFENSTFNFFLINKNIHDTENIFTTVKRNDINVRLTAQEGAFLNFDSLFDIKKTKIKKISRVKVELFFDEKRNDSSNSLLNGLQKASKKAETLINNELKELNDSVLSKDKKAGIENKYADFVEHVASKKELDAMIERVKKDIESNEKIISFCFHDIQNDIRRKLSEYYYLEEKLYPDFPTYISYQKNKFIK